MSQFKPTRAELNEVRRFAHEVEVHARAAAILDRSCASAGNAYRFRARDYSTRAFSLAQSVAHRGQ